MEFLRRLRFIWACFCALNIAAALFMGLGWYAVAAAVGMMAFYVPGSAFKKLTVLWFGYVGIITYGTIIQRDPAGAVVAVTIVGALWAVAATAVWLFGGFKQHS